MNLQLTTIANMMRNALQPLAVEDRCKVIASVCSTLATGAPEPTFARSNIEQAIAATRNLNDAAALLGCSRRTLNHHMTKLGIPSGTPGRRPRTV